MLISGPPHTGRTSFLPLRLRTQVRTGACLHILTNGKKRCIMKRQNGSIAFNACSDVSPLTARVYKSPRDTEEINPY